MFGVDRECFSIDYWLLAAGCWLLDVGAWLPCSSHLASTLIISLHSSETTQPHANALTHQLAQSLLGFLSIHFPSLFGGSEKAKQVYKYHRLSGYVLIAGLLFTAHLGGGHSAWAVGIKGVTMKVVRVAAFWVGTVLMFVGVVVRMR